MSKKRFFDLNGIGSLSYIMNKMNRSDYEIVCVQEDKIFLVDLDLGNKSVTNDAENVVEEINKNFPDKRIIYRDTLGVWDEIVIDRRRSYAEFAPYTEELPDFSLTNCPSSELLRT